MEGEGLKERLKLLSVNIQVKLKNEDIIRAFPYSISQLWIYVSAPLAM
jgi:hypothetical protein